MYERARKEALPTRPTVFMVRLYASWDWLVAVGSIRTRTPNGIVPLEGELELQSTVLESARRTIER